MPYKDKAVQRDKQRAYYYRNHDKILAYWKARRKTFPEPGRRHSKEQRLRYERFIFAYKLCGQCSICGFKGHPECLDFHHLFDKKFALSRAGTRNKKKILHEIYKCVLICANCHRRIHANTLTEAELARANCSRDENAPWGSK